MYKFVTCFDSGYLARGIVLINSLNSTQDTEQLKIWVVCLDQATYYTLKTINQPNVVPIPLANLECSELLEVKQVRTKQEYFWTLTPFIIDFILKQNPDISIITYIDADMEFYQDVKPIFSDFKWDQHSILITPHFYSKLYDQSLVSGTYCVQWITVLRNDKTRLIHRWKEQCLKWCYATPEPGLFGDQYYLEDWPKLHPDNVHVLSNAGAILGPWSKFYDTEIDGLIAYHFHGCKFLSEKLMFKGNYIIFSRKIKLLYLNYFKKITLAHDLYVKKNLPHTTLVMRIKIYAIKAMWNIRQLIRYYGK